MTAVQCEVLIVAGDEAEGTLLVDLLGHTRVPCAVSWTRRVEGIGARIEQLSKGDRLCGVIIDTRVCAFPASVEDLGKSLKLARRAAPVIYYSAFLDVPGLDSLIRETQGAIRIDKRRAGWPRALLRVLDVCLFRRRFLEGIDALRNAQPKEQFPIAPSVTSELQFLTSLAREVPEIFDRSDVDVSARSLLEMDNSNGMRFGNTLPIRSAEIDSRKYQVAPNRYSEGPFHVRAWRPERDSMALLAGMLRKSFEQIAAARGSTSLPNVRAWILDIARYANSGGLERLYSDLPFVDCAENPLMVAFGKIEVNSLAGRKQLTTTIHREMMHLVNRVERCPLTTPWIWFDEAMANWHALRSADGEYGTVRMPPGVPLDELGNRFAGLYFLQFLEAKFGAALAFKLWRSSDPDVFAAIRSATPTGGSLLIEFFLWAWERTVLEEHDGDRGTFRLPHASYVLLPAADLKLRMRGRGRQGCLVMLPASPNMFPRLIELPAEIDFSEATGWAYALVINTATPRHTAAPQSFMIDVEFERLRSVASALRAPQKL